jgi:hypothetical protein
VTKSQVTEQLRRDALRLDARDIDLLSTVEDTSDFGHEPSVVLVSLRELDETITEQCLEIFEGYEPDEWTSYVYVPLAHGPIQEVSR